MFFTYYVAMICVILLLPIQKGHTEVIQVKGTIQPVIVSNLERMKTIYNVLYGTQNDQIHFYLHVLGTLNPGNRMPPYEHVYLDTHDGHVPLFKKGGNEIILPNKDYDGGNPNVMLALLPKETIDFRGTVTFMHAPIKVFSDHEARLWMTLLDQRIARKAGWITSFFIPHVDEIILSIPAASEFDVCVNSQVRPLVVNKSNEMYQYHFSPYQFPQGASFSSNGGGIQNISLVLPNIFNSWKNNLFVQ